MGNQLRDDALRDNRDDALRDELRRQLGAPALDWSEPPRPGGSGAESIVLELSLRDAGSWSRVPLVARLLRIDAPNQLAREAAVQGALSDAGFPAPRPVAVGPGTPGVLPPFLVMQRARGRVMFSLLPVMVGLCVAFIGLGFGWIALALGLGWYSLAVWLQRWLHRLPADRVTRAIAAAGVDPAEFGVDAWVERLADDVDRLGLDALAPAIDWLRKHRPPSHADVVCHGDYWAGNVMVSTRGVTALIDWANTAIAPREFDLAWNRVQHGGDLPPSDRIPEPWRGWLGSLLQPVAWTALFPHRWLYRTRHSLDRSAMNYFTAFHTLRILIWSYASEAATGGGSNPWSSRRSRRLNRRRFARITGVVLEQAVGAE